MHVMVVMPLGDRLGGSELMLERLLVAATEPSTIRFSCVFFAEGPLTQAVRAAGVPTVVIPVGRLRQPVSGLRGVVRLARLLSRSRPDVILSWMGTAHVYAAPAALLSRTNDRLVWWQHGRPGRDLLERLLHTLPTQAVGCSSHDVAADERAAFGSRTFVVHPGLPLASFDEELRRVDRHRLQKHWGLPSTAQVVTIVGRLQRWKNQHLVIQALKQLREEGQDVHLLVVGGDSYGRDPEYAQLLRTRVGELGLRDHVSFTGHLDSVVPALAVSDVLINASSAEPFGIVLLEAMAARLAVVAVDRGGPREVVLDGSTGVLVADADVDMLTRGLCEALVDGIRQEMGAAGRRRVEEHFTANGMVVSLTRHLAAL